MRKLLDSFHSHGYPWGTEMRLSCLGMQREKRMSVGNAARIFTQSMEGTKPTSGVAAPVSMRAGVYTKRALGADENFTIYMVGQGSIAELVAMLRLKPSREYASSNITTLGAMSIVGLQSIIQLRASRTSLSQSIGLSLRGFWGDPYMHGKTYITRMVTGVITALRTLRCGWLINPLD